MNKSAQREIREDFISLKIDFAFKHVMKNKKVLRGLLGAVFNIAPEEITDIEFRDPHLNKSSSDEKQGILDIRITINHMEHINIELQVTPFKYWKNRSMFYNFKMFVNQASPGSKYEEFTPCIHISILDFNLFPESKKFHSKIQLIDTENYKLFTDKIVFHMIELGKIQYTSPKGSENELYHWCELMNANSEEEYQLLSEKNEYIKEAVDELEKIKQDRWLKEEYLKRQMAIMDEATQKASYYEDGLEDGMKQGLEQGIEQGIEQERQRGRLETVTNAIKLGLTNEQIHTLTDMAEEDIEKLRIN